MEIILKFIIQYNNILIIISHLIGITHLLFFFSNSHVCSFVFSKVHIDHLFETYVIDNCFVCQKKSEKNPSIWNIYGLTSRRAFNFIGEGLMDGALLFHVSPMVEGNLFENV